MPLPCFSPLGVLESGGWEGEGVVGVLPGYFRDGALQRRSVLVKLDRNKGSSTLMTVCSRVVNGAVPRRVLR